MITQCPNCKQDYEVDDNCLGETIVCEICKNTFVIETNRENISNKSSKQSKNVLICIFESLLILVLGVVLFFFYQKNVEINNQNLALLEKEEQTEKELALTKTELEKIQKAVKDAGSESLAETANLLIERNNLKDDLKRLEQEKDNEIGKLKKEIGILRGQIEEKRSTPITETTPSATTAKPEQKTAPKKVDDATLTKRHIVKKYDFMEEITWFNTDRKCSSEVYGMNLFTIQLYMGQTKENRLLLRLKTAYLDTSSAVAEIQREARAKGIVLKDLKASPTTSKWLFYDRILIKGNNGKSVRLDIKSSDKDSEIGDVEGLMFLKEWSDSYVSDVAEDLIEISKASKIYVKVYGHYEFEFEMSKDQIYAFKEMMQLYNTLKQ